MVGSESLLDDCCIKKITVGAGVGYSGEQLSEITSSMYGGSFLN